MNQKVLIAVTTTLFAVFGFFISVDIKAGINENVSGWAWSNMFRGAADPLGPHDSTIGWISFNSSNCDTDNNGFSNGGAGCPSAGTAIASYGVHINSNGNLTGYAWSENIGWISFAPAGPYPASPNYSACLDLSGSGQACDGVGNYKLSGWLRALAYGNGWDGWIKLRGIALDGSPYGVDITQSTGDFSGWAWGSDVVGWINFQGSSYGAKTTFPFNNAPVKPTTFEVNWNRCAFAGSAVPTLSWTYSDPDGNPQAGYEIEVDDNSSFNAPKFNVVVNVPSTAYLLNLHDDQENPDDLPLSMQDYQLDWNSSYFWRVRVEDNQGSWSEWSNSSQSKTDKHASPWVQFSFTPTEPTQKEVVEFIDQTQTFGEVTIVSHLWTVTQGTGVFVDSVPTDANPYIKLLTLDNRIKLEVTDSDNYSCESPEQEITATLPLPEYKEVPPIIWLGRALAVLVDVFNVF